MAAGHARCSIYDAYLSESSPSDFPLSSTITNDLLRISGIVSGMDVLGNIKQY